MPIWLMRSCFLHRVAHGQALAQVQGHRLLQVDVLAGLAGVDRLQRVPVRRRGDDHRVDVLLREQLAVVAVGLGGLLVPAGDRLRGGLRTIAGRGDDDVGMGRAVPQVALAHAAAADQPDVDPLVRPGAPSPPQGLGGHEIWSGCDNDLGGGHLAHEAAS